jgi:hypothetical protein
VRVQDNLACFDRCWRKFQGLKEKKRPALLNDNLCQINKYFLLKSSGY